MQRFGHDRGRGGSPRGRAAYKAIVHEPRQGSVACVTLLQGIVLDRGRYGPLRVHDASEAIGQVYGHDQGRESAEGAAWVQRFVHDRGRDGSRYDGDASEATEH